MRQMIDEMVEKPQEKNLDDRLEIQSLTRAERRKYKKEKLRETTEGMSRSEKIKYLLYYYKEAIILTIAAIVVIIIIANTVIQNVKPITLSYAVVNCADQLSFNTDAIEQYAKDIDKYKGCQIQADTNVYISGDEYSQGYEGNANSQKYITFTMMTTSNYYDVIFTDMKGAEACAAIDIFYPIDKYLDEATYNKIKDRTVTLKNMEGQEEILAIDVSDVELAKSMNVGYDKIYIGFAGDEQRNHDAVQDLLNYMFPD